MTASLLQQHSITERRKGGVGTTLKIINYKKSYLYPYSYIPTPQEKVSTQTQLLCFGVHAEINSLIQLVNTVRREEGWVKHTL